MVSPNLLLSSIDKTGQYLRCQKTKHNIAGEIGKILMADSESLGDTE